MSEDAWQVVFTGRLVEGARPDEVHAALAALFRKDPEQIKAVFSRAGAVLVKQATREQATRYVAAVERAGAVCEIRPLGAGEPSPAAKAAAVGRTVAVKAAAADPSLSPIAVRIGTDGTGLTTSRRDLPQLAFGDMVAIAAFESGVDHGAAKLLLFIRSSQRPLIVDMDTFDFNLFPGVAGSDLHGSLRNLLLFLQRKNGRVVLEQGTARFMSGGEMPVLVKNPAVLAAALYHALGDEAPRDPNEPASEEEAGANESTSETADTESAAYGEDDGRWFDLEQWMDRWMRLAGFALLAGFAWPLLSHSLLFGGNVVLWPWQLMGFGMDAEDAAASATVAQAAHMAPWALVPLVAAALALIGRGRGGGLVRSGVMFIVGAAALLLQHVVFVGESEIFRLLLVPPTAAGGAMVFVLILAGAALAAANHLRNDFDDARGLRVIAGVGAVIVLVATLLALLAGSWGGWSIHILYLLLAVYGGLGLHSALQAEADSAEMIGKTARAVLAWFPIACIFTQSATDDPYLTIVVQAGGGTLNDLFATIKFCLVDYGAAILMASGLTGLLGAWLLGWEVPNTAQRGASIESGQAAARQGTSLPLRPVAIGGVVLVIVVLGLATGGKDEPSSQPATAAPAPRAPVPPPAVVENSARRQLEFAVMSAAGAIECGYSDVGYAYYTPSASAERLVSLMNSAGAGNSPAFVLGAPTGPWQIAVSGDDDGKKVLLEGYGTDLNTPLITRELRCS